MDEDDLLAINQNNSEYSASELHVQGSTMLPAPNRGIVTPKKPVYPAKNRPSPDKKPFLPAIFKKRRKILREGQEEEEETNTLENGKKIYGNLGAFDDIFLGLPPPSNN